NQKHWVTMWQSLTNLFDINHLIRTNPCPNSTTSSLVTMISVTIPSFGAGISFMTFMASIISKVCPFLTVSPTETKTGLSGAGAKYATPTRGLVTSSPSTRGVSSVSLTASASDEDGEETTGATGTALTGGTATG